MNARVEVDPVLVSCSVRYALGRHSYLPGLVADEVRRTWPELGEQRAVIRDDIARWLEQMGASDYVMGAGWSTARPTWEQLLRWIDTEEGRAWYDNPRDRDHAVEVLFPGAEIIEVDE